MDLVCPQHKTSLLSQDGSYYCPSGGHAFPFINGVPHFVESDFYWGEIPQSAMQEILAVMAKSGYQAGLDLLESKFPGRSQFVFDIGRADFRLPIDIKTGLKILDLGCGWGTHAFPLAALGAEVYAVDITKERVEFVRQRKDFEKVQNIYPLLANVMDLPFADASFDVIISNGVLEWVGLQEQFGRPQEVQQKFLADMKRLLKDDGVLYVGIENRVALSYFARGVDHSGLRYTSLLPRWLANVYTRLRLKKPYLTYTYTYSGYKRLFKQADFGGIDTYIPFPGYNHPDSLVPYQSLSALKFFLMSRGRWRHIKSRFWQAILFNRLMLKIFRFFSYSFAFYLKK